MSLIDDIKNDREAGTPGNFIADFYGEDDFDGVPILSEHRGRMFVAIANCPVDYTDREQRLVDVKRIARVPDMEAALLAADALADAADQLMDEVDDGDGYTERAAVDLAKALAAYREATK